jgi:hypothetical protein
MPSHKELEPLLSSLLGVCADFTARMERESENLLSKREDKDVELVFREPYVPYLPGKSPRVLVLAESQNLSGKMHRRFVQKLKNESPDGKFLRLANRLGQEGDAIGVQPWDNGILKVAVQAARGLDPATVAVSNAVPWSWVRGEANARPFHSKVKRMAADFWTAVFEQWKPDCIICAGAVARDVMRKARPASAKVVEWALPSPRMRSTAKMFKSEDLMRRFGIAERVAPMLESLKSPADHDLAAFYACHAVSKSGRSCNDSGTQPVCGAGPSA